MPSATSRLPVGRPPVGREHRRIAWQAIEPMSSSLEPGAPDSPPPGNFRKPGARRSCWKPAIGSAVGAALLYLLTALSD